jgi:uncharacterized caspase-like protein
MAQTDAFGVVNLWDLKSGALRRTIIGSKVSNCLAFSTDSRLLAVSGDGRGTLNAGKGRGTTFAIRLWDHLTGRLKITLDGHLDGVYALAFSPDGHTLASIGSFDDTVKLWNAETGALLKSIKVETASSPTNIAYSPDGKTIAWGEMAKGNVGFQRSSSMAFYDVQTGQITRTPTSHKAILGNISFSPDGSLLASMSDTIILWDVAGRKESRVLRGADKPGYTGPLSFSSDGKSLVSGRLGGITVWDVASGTPSRSLTNQSRNIRLTTFLPGTNLLASSGNDAIITLWNVESGNELARLAILDKKEWVVVAPDGRFDGKPSAWGKILWRFKGDTLNFAPVEIYFKEFYAPGILADAIATGQSGRVPSDISLQDRRQPQVKLSLAEGSPASIKDAATRSVKVKVEVSEAPPDQEHALAAGVRDVRLFRNGSLVKAWRGDLKTEGGKVILETTVPTVAGDNRFTAYAFNRDDIKSADAVLAFSGPEFLRRKGTAYILAIGLNNYANSEFNLRYAVPDAESFGAEVRNQITSSGLYERVEAVTLRDAEATKGNILAALKRLAGTDNEALTANSPESLKNLKPAQPEDAVIIFFAGHGTAQKGSFYFIPHDLGFAGKRNREEVTANLQTILSHSISDKELESAMERVDAAQLLLVIDACNSGQALESDEARRGPMNSRGLAQLAYEKGMYILTAAQSYQAALEASKLGHGYLTYALVEEGLKKQTADVEPKDGRVTAREWLDYATERVPAMQQEGTSGKRQLVQEGSTNQAQQKSVQPETSVQQPRVFYRREADEQMWIVSTAASTASAGNSVSKFREEGVNFDYHASWLLQKRSMEKSLIVTLTQPDTGARIEITVERQQSFAYMEAQKRFSDVLVAGYIRNLESQGAKVLERTETTTDLKGMIATGYRLRIARGEDVEVIEFYWTALNHRLTHIVISSPEKSLQQMIPNWQAVRNSLKVE